MSITNVEVSKFVLEPEFPNFSLVFLGGFTDFDEWDTPQRGYRSGVCLEINERNYPLFFYDIVRLQQDLIGSAQWGLCCIAEYGMIVIDEVTLEKMISTAKALLKTDYFSKQKSYSSIEIIDLLTPSLANDTGRI